MTAMLFEFIAMVSQHSEERNLLLRPIHLCLSLSERTGRENSATLQHDSSAGRKDSSEETVARVCSFLHSFFVDLLRELLAGDIGQAPVIQS